MNDTISRIIVLGGGSSGLLAAISLKIKLPQLDVVVIRSTALGTIMVGEGTTDSVPVFLHGYLGIDPARFHAEASPTWKMGIRFLWGPRSQFNYTFSRQLTTHYEKLPRPNGFYCRDVFDYCDPYGAMMLADRVFERTASGAPAIVTNMAYHLENAKLVDFLETYAAECGVQMIDDTVADVRTGPAGVEALVLESGREETADLFVDSSGFRSVLLGQALEEPFQPYNSTLFCDRAIVGGWQRTDEPIKPYTISETMTAGWAWQIEHEHQINRGYVYSSAFLSDEQAEQEFRAKNPKVGTTRVVKFVAGSYRRHWVKNVVAIGNAGGFVEPLQSTSLAVICELCAGLVRALVEGGQRRSESQSARFNHMAGFLWSSVRNFLAINYKFNTRIETPFWRACLHEVDLAGAAEVAEYYRANGPSTAWAAHLISPLDPFGFEGYLTMLVGQKAPHDCPYEPSQQEWQFWNAARAQFLARAQNALTVRESLDYIRQGAWQWNPEFYRRGAGRW